MPVADDVAWKSGKFNAEFIYIRFTELIVISIVK